MDPQTQPGMYQQNNLYDQQTVRWRKGLIAIGLAVLVGLAIYSLVSSYIVRQNTGILSITPTEPSADIHVQQAGTEQKALGKGTTSIRLSPGTYTVTATTDNAATSQVVTITKKQKIELSLTLTAAVPQQSIARYTAQNLYAAPDNNLYFINTLEGVPYAYPLGGEEARPYNTSLNDITNLYWLSPTQLISEASTGEWQYTHNGTSRPLTYGEELPTSGSVSTNVRGAISFVATDKSIVYTDSPAVAPSRLGSVTSEQAKTSIAPNGDVLVYTPRISYTDPTERTILYRQGTPVTLPEALTGIIQATWKPDSSAFSYVTTQGIFVYDLTSNTVTKVLAATPTNTKAMVWADNTTLVYAQNQTLWAYKQSANSSAKLTTFQGNFNGQQSLSLGNDGKSIYYSTTEDSSNKGGAIYSVIYNYRQLSNDEQKAAAKAQQQTSQHTVAYTGLDALSDLGLAFDQAKSTRFALGSFVSTLSEQPKGIIIEEPQLELKPGATDTIHFTFVTDVSDTPYRATLDFTSITTIRLYVYDSKSGVLLFDSQPINAQQ